MGRPRLNARAPAKESHLTILPREATAVEFYAACEKRLLSNFNKIFGNFVTLGGFEDFKNILQPQNVAMEQFQQQSLVSVLITGNTIKFSVPTVNRNIL